MVKNVYVDAENLPLGSSLELTEALNSLRWNSDGLIPVITQQESTGEVLMMAWMNRRALEITLQEQQVCYWSRSRKSLWRKGETSGNVQRLKVMRIDCDGDCLLCLVDQTGPACHTGRSNCFYLQVDKKRVVMFHSPL